MEEDTHAVEPTEDNNTHAVYYDAPEKRYVLAATRYRRIIDQLPGTMYFVWVLQEMVVNRILSDP